jgi:hypothetical protein
MLLLAGCTQFHDYFDERLATARNEHFAEIAWKRYEATVGSGRDSHFRDGFIAGYVDVRRHRGSD